MLQLPNNEAGPPPTTASYVDNRECTYCHGGINATYGQTPHSYAFLSLPASSPYYNVSDCRPCHSTGAGYPGIYPATGYGNWTNANPDLQNVTCQACHGPGSLHINASTDAEAQQTIGLIMDASLCGSCHSEEAGLSGEHHPTYNEWSVSRHANTTLPSYVQNTTQCSNCHDAWNAMQFLETGVYKTTLRAAGEDAPVTWQIACATCHDPHSNASGSQLRLPADEICAKCHNAGGAQPGAAPHHPMAEMRNNTAGYGIDRTNTNYMPDVSCYNCHLSFNNRSELPNHTFAPNPSACVVCHNTTFGSDAVAASYIRTIESITRVQVGVATPAVDEASAIMTQMAGNRTNENIATWNDQYEIALFNLESVTSDSSNGNHNPGLASVLLNDAMSRSDSIVTALTPPDKISGVQVTRGADGTVTVNWSASSASDFTKYRIYVLTTDKSNVTSETWKAEVTSQTTETYSISDLDKDTTYFVYVTAVDTKGNEITNTLNPFVLSKATAEKQGLTAMDLGLVGVVVILAVLAALLGMMLMRKNKGVKPETTEKKEE